MDKLINGLSSMGNDLTSRLLILVPIVAALLIVVQSVKYITAEDNEKPAITKSIRTIILIAGFAFCASAIITWVLSYFS